MNKIGVLYHPGRKDAVVLAERVAALLDGLDQPTWQGAADQEMELAAVAPELSLVITLGGDGTIVRAVHAVAASCVPILGVNLGRLGFLAEVEPEDIETALPAVLAGEYILEERMMLRAEVWREGLSILSAEAINDVVVGHGPGARTVRYSVQVDGHYVMTQTADAIIASTPTGSTAYCMAAGGPIVAPDLNCITLTPVAAHLSMAHAIVVPARRTVQLCLIKGQNAILTIDGHHDVALEGGDEVRTMVSANTAKFIRFGGDGYFYETVLRRLRWPDRGPIP